MNSEQLHTLLAAGVKHGASDIHFRVGGPPTYRVRGGLAQLKYNPLAPSDTEDLARLIIRDAKVLVEQGRTQYGMQSFDQHLTDLFRANAITLETALAAASNKADFERALHFSQ